MIECFTFLRMGGELERIHLMPLRGLEACTVRERFRTFDVNEASCSQEETTQLLLSVVESGFGDLETFNSLVRGIFTDKLDGDDFFETFEDERTPLESGASHEQLGLMRRQSVGQVQAPCTIRMALRRSVRTSYEERLRTAVCTRPGA